MDKEGQNTGSSVFHSESIGSQATPEYFSNIKGGKKDKEKVQKIRSARSRKPLFIILGIIAAILLIIMIIALVRTFNHPRGSRTDEEMPTDYSEIERRTYEHLYENAEADYKKALLYISDLIKDMEELNQSPDAIFVAEVVRTKIIYQGGLRDRAITLALNLARTADNDVQKYYIYSALQYMYHQEGNTGKSDFYAALLDELNVFKDTEGEGGIADEYEESEEDADGEIVEYEETDYELEPSEEE